MHIRNLKLNLACLFHGGRGVYCETSWQIHSGWGWLVENENYQPWYSQVISDPSSDLKPKYNQVKWPAREMIQFRSFFMRHGQCGSLCGCRFQLICWGIVLALWRFWCCKKCLRQKRVSNHQQKADQWQARWLVCLTNTGRPKWLLNDPIGELSGGRARPRGPGGSMKYQFVYLDPKMGVDPAKSELSRVWTHRNGYKLWKDRDKERCKKRLELSAWLMLPSRSRFSSICLSFSIAAFFVASASSLYLRNSLNSRLAERTRRLARLSRAELDHDLEEDLSRFLGVSPTQPWHRHYQHLSKDQAPPIFGR